MADGYPFTYFKVSPQNFGTTVYDTDDLSITRGGSLTILALPEMLLSHLKKEFKALAFETLSHAASELVFRVVQAGEARVKTRAVKFSPPKGANKSKWRKALNDAKNNLSEGFGDADLNAAATTIATVFDALQSDDAIKNIAGQIWSITGATTHAAASGHSAISPAQQAEMKQKIRAFVTAKSGNLPFDLLIYGVASDQPSAADAPLAKTLARLETKLGRQQLQQLTCPAPPPAIKTSAVCAYTGLFAAEHTVKEKPASASAWRRHEVGRREKAGFYSKVLSVAGADAERLHSAGLHASARDAVDAALADIRSALPLLKDDIAGFAESFEEIVAAPPKDVSLSVQAGLSVLTMDGNGFGGLRAEVTEFGQLKTFATYLDVLKAGLLAKLLVWVHQNAMHETKVKFETLLWGGDEFTFVAPAWVGWDMARLLQEAIACWVAPFSGAPLHFSTGLVFGPHNAPIRDLRQAAADLCDAAKHDRTQSLIQVLAYEGVDRTQFSPSAFREKWLGALEEDAEAAFSLTAVALDTLPERMQDIAKGVGKSAIHKWYLEYKPVLAEKNPDNARITAWEEDINRIGRFGSDKNLRSLGIWDESNSYPLLTFAQACLLLDYLPAEAST